MNLIKKVTLILLLIMIVVISENYVRSKRTIEYQDVEQTSTGIERILVQYEEIQDLFSAPRIPFLPKGSRIETESEIKYTERKPTPEPVETTPTPIPIYDIALSQELQEYTYKIAQEYSINYELVLSVMFVESSYRDWITGGSGERGLMQIHPINFPKLRQELGITDFYNPKQNILAGVYMLADLNDKYEDVDRILMAYNMGESGARRVISRGISKSRYSINIRRVREKLMHEGGL